MNFADYQMEWPRENLTVRCFAHDIMNYRYHWHQDVYELNVLLYGTQDYCRGAQSQMLNENDVILTPPGVGHASMSHQANTCAIVVHFSSSVLRSLLPKGKTWQFPSCLSCKDTQDEMRYRKIRFYVAQILTAMRLGGPYAQVCVRANTDLLAVTLCSDFDPQSLHEMPENEQRQASFRSIISYVENHYAERLTLEQLAEYAQYNRTYISTLFKQVVGVNFHEYLTRVRFQHSLNDLALTTDNLTDIALRNGFADLKSFNAYFRSALQRTPAEYRAQLSPDRIMAFDRKYLPSDDAVLQRKIQEYLHIGG